MSVDGRPPGNRLRNMGGGALLFLAMLPLPLLANGDGNGNGGAFYVNDFEQAGDDTPARGWSPFGTGTIHRTPSFYASPSNYASRIPSAHGRFHARLRTNGCIAPANCLGPSTNWGTVSAPATFRPYVTEIDVFLDVGWTMSPAPRVDNRFDWSSAINTAAGGFHRDYVFNAGTDANLADGFQPGFFINASTNATRGSSFPQNPCPNPPNSDLTCRTPVHITTSGWYTFRHHFRNDGGVLAVDMSILRHNALVKMWTIKVPTDLITLIGDDRYGWFVINEINDLAADCSVKRSPGGRHPGLFTRCAFGDVEDDDDDDFDDDGERDDEDIDDDNDGHHDNEDADDDNDGQGDDEDADDDNDGIKDRFDSQSHRERQRTSGGDLNPGESHSYEFTADAGSLLLMADADVLSASGGLPVNPTGLLASSLVVEILDPLGTVVASSALVPGVPIVTVAPVISGVHTVRISNRSTKVLTYESSRIVREAWD